MTLEELLGLGLAVRAQAEELGRAYLALEQCKQALVAMEKAKAEVEAKLVKRPETEEAVP